LNLSRFESTDGWVAELERFGDSIGATAGFFGLPLLFSVCTNMADYR